MSEGQTVLIPKDRVQRVKNYMEDNQVGVQKACKALGISMATYYNDQKRQQAPTSAPKAEPAKILLSAHKPKLSVERDDVLSTVRVIAKLETMSEGMRLRTIGTILDSL